MLNAHWRKVQRRFIYRQGSISNSLNSPKLDEAFQTRKLNFPIFDPFACKYKQHIDFNEYISIHHNPYIRQRPLQILLIRKI